MVKIEAITPNVYRKNFISANIPPLAHKPLENKQDVGEIECECFINDNFGWLKNYALKSALKELYTIEFDKNDIEYLKSIGLKVPFESGKDVVKYIASENIRIDFDQIPEPDIHAHYNYEKNLICINNKYKNSQSKPIILAIASTILHETSHAKDKDGVASIQEELECLGMNAVAHRAFIKKYSDIFKNLNIPIIQDGVNLYADLFFNYPNLDDLMIIVKSKYGNLPAGCDKHPPSNLACRIKSGK